MTLRTCIGIGLILLFGVSGFAQKNAYQADALIGVEQLKEDFKVLHLTVGLGHPAWGHYYPVDSMENWFRQTNAKIQEPMTEQTFLRLLYPLIAKLGCGHTRLQNSRAYVKAQKQRDSEEIKRQYPPVQLLLLEDKLWVRKVTSPDSQLIAVGAEVLAIDGRSAAEITQALFQRVTSDGYNQTQQERTFNLRFDGYYRFHFGDQEIFSISQVSPEGDTATVELRANAATLAERLVLSGYAKAKRLRKGKTILSKRGYHLRLLEGDERTAIMDIRGFRQRRGKKFYRDAFSYLQKAKVDNLIIDLRDNGGGAVKDAGRLLSYLLTEETELQAYKKWKEHPYEKYFRQKHIYKLLVPLILPFYFKSKKTGETITLQMPLKPRKKDHFDGQVFVLNNGRTFSASVLVGAYLDEQNRATFIGQETGGGQTGTNAFLMPQLELPNSKVRLIFPLYTIEHQISAEDIGRGLMPDYEVNYSLDDVLQNRDLEMEKIKELLASPK